ncbi:MAG: PAS domain S-box protein [Herbaspirillum sp.]
MSFGTIASIIILLFFTLLFVLNRRLRDSVLQIQKSRDIFIAALEGSLDALYVLIAIRDADQKILDFHITEANQRAAMLVEIPLDKLIGGQLCQLLPSARIDGFFDKCVDVVERQTPFEEECEVPNRNGGTRWWHHQRIPINGGLVINSRDISARKQIETENRNSHNFLQSLIEYIPALIFVKSLPSNKPGNMIVWNKAAETATGYPVHAIRGKTLDQIFPKHIAQAYQRFSDGMLAQPRVINQTETVFRHTHDKQLRHFHSIVVPLFDASGKPEYMLGIGIDVTSQCAQEQQLRAKQAELRAVNDASPLGLFRTDANGKCTYVNQTYEDMSGLHGTAALGTGWVQSIHPQDRLKIFQAWSRSSRKHQGYQDVYRFLHDDGSVVWVSTKMAPILLDGKLHGYAGSVDDITARLDAEKKLNDSAKRLRTIADSVPALIAFVDTEHYVVFSNLLFEQAYGMPNNPVCGRTIHAVVGTAVYARIQPYIEQALRGNNVKFETDEIRRGKYRCTELTYTPQFDNAMPPQVVGFHVMGQDITAKKIHERRLLKLSQSDSLTGLLNHAGFQDKLHQALTDSDQSRNLVALICLDIDHFKFVNDTYGHPIGDALLKAFAARLLRTLRAIDSVARLGGDEFTIIMENLTKPNVAIALAEKIGQIMRSPFALENLSVSITVSIGVAFYPYAGTNTAKKLLKQADEMLYQAKNAGRDTYRSTIVDTMEEI